MDWSKIKTIFILTFLVLNVYLLYEYFSLTSQEREVIPKNSLEERLKEDNITIKPSPPKEEMRGQLLSAQPKVFTETELKSQKLEDQKSLDGAVILDKDETFKISNNFDPKELDEFIKENILYGDQYRFWEKRDSTITYYQVYGDQVFYQNKNAQLTFYLNEENEIVSYSQTMLGNIEKIGEETKLISPISAIEILIKNGKISPDSEITDYELGYHTYVDISTTQVLTPAWRIVINGEENLFVHGIAGDILELNKEETKTVE